MLGDADTTTRLIADGADVNDTNEDGYTPMHLAAIYGELECVRLLLQNNANKEAPDNDGKTPLHWAAHEGKVECVAALLEAGAMKNASNKGGSRPLHFAAFNGEEGIDFSSYNFIHVDRSRRQGAIADQSHTRRHPRAVGAFRRLAHRR